MEIEVKIRLPNAESHTVVASLLSSHLTKTHFQENLFFDTKSNALSAKRAVLRIRFYQNDSRCVISLKAKAVLTNGVSRVEEDEEEIDPLLARAYVASPEKLVELNSRIMARVKTEFDFDENEDEHRFVCLGGFKNVRNVYEWNGLTLELDETDFGFGTCYEIECESNDPERAKGILEGFLKENGVRYEYSEMSKFAIFRSGKMPPGPERCLSAGAKLA